VIYYQTLPLVAGTATSFKNYYFTICLFCFCAEKNNRRKPAQVAMDTEFRRYSTSRAIFKKIIQGLPTLSPFKRERKSAQLLTCGNLR
jgi:hypothetical protein